jgi:hypothetical protein
VDLRLLTDAASRVLKVPEAGPEVPRRNRLLEIYGLGGAIGEQLGSAWTAEQDLHLFIETEPQRTAEHQRLMRYWMRISAAGRAEMAPNEAHSATLQAKGYEFESPLASPSQDSLSRELDRAS